MTSFQPDTSNREFRQALELIKYTRQSLFLTGKAGTGKSTSPPSTPGAARCTASSACPSTRCCRTTPT